MRTLFIQKENLKENITKIKEYVVKKEQGNDTKIIAVVKCNGYGLGAVEFVKYLIENGIELFAVATLEEAMQLRQAGIKNEILMLSCTAIKQELETLIENNIIVTIGSKKDIEILEQIAEEKNIKVRAHLKIDTGMGRYGFVDNAKEDLINNLKSIKNIKIEGTFSHFSSSYYDEQYTKMQFNKFLDIVQTLKENGIDTGMLHICNSSAFIKYPEMHLDAVRIGSAFLGRLSFENSLKLNPIGYLETKVVEIKEIDKDRYISYSNAYKTNKKIKVAIVPCGYSDGFNVTTNKDMFRKMDRLRDISRAMKDLFKKEKITVRIANQECMVLGRVGTHHVVCDITGKNVKVEDNVIIKVNPKYVDSNINRVYI